MKKIISFAAIFLVAGSIIAADYAPKDAVIKAAKKLAASKNYSWLTTVEVVGGRFRPGPTDGQTEKNGFTTLAFTMGDNSAQAVLKGTNGVLKTDGDWQSMAEVVKDDNSDPGPIRFVAMRLQNFKTPAAEAESFALKANDLKLTDGVYSGELSDEAAKASLSFGRPGQNGAAVTGAKGTVKFWITHGALTKYEFQVQGHVEFGGNGRDVNRTTTTEIKDVGKTKVQVSDDAKKKLS